MDRDLSAPIYSVSQLNQEIRYFLEEHIAPLWINGEISNFVCPSSGHWYFSLKDSKSALRCAFFQPKLRGIKFIPKSGDQVLLHGRISLYEPRGEYQFICDYIEPAGDGLLQQQFNLLKEKLFQAGLFDEKLKKILPTFPKTIGIITSPTGAAVHDILYVLNKRFNLANIILYPTLVQGSQAASEIAQAIKTANLRQECDVIILGRGGGSIEDLWPFNEEIVAHAIYESEIPIVSAVGHEIDFTIADFVADVRAPTPSAAAALVSPNQIELLQQLSHLYQRLKTQHPEHQLIEHQQKLDRLEQDLYKIINYVFTQKQNYLSELSRSLNALSPLNILDKGYAFLQKDNSQNLITSVKQINLKENIKAKLKDGELICRVEEII